MEDLLSVTKDKFPDLDISRRHLNRIVKDNYISLKMTRYRHEPIKRFGKDIDINKQLKVFYQKVKDYELEDIICIDETSINSLEKRGHCYSEVGKRCIIKSHSQDVFKKYTGIFAISSKGVLGWKLYDKGGIYTDRLLEFLEEILTRRKGKLLILDNVSCHRNEKVKEYINLNNDLLYSIPYQHYTNAIENFFSILKSKLYKLNGYKYEEIKTNISRVIKDINITSYKNILRSAYNRENYINKIRKPMSRKMKKYKD
jgi:transposase